MEDVLYLTHESAEVCDFLNVKILQFNKHIAAYYFLNKHINQGTSLQNKRDLLFIGSKNQNDSTSFFIYIYFRTLISNSDCTNAKCQIASKPSIQMTNHE